MNPSLTLGPLSLYGSGNAYYIAPYGVEASAGQVNYMLNLANQQGGTLRKDQLQSLVAACPAASPVLTASLGFGALTAAAVPVIPTHPPSAHFSNPALDAPTSLTITADGRIYGHAALWGTCHIGKEGACLQPPKSRTDYQHYRLKSVLTADAQEIPVGTITMQTGHAGLDLGARFAAAHYDDTGTAVADVVTGEDKHGIWFSGALRPSLTPEHVRTLRASALSGDWRRIGSNLELVALLAVNVPGFPVPRSLAASGQFVSQSVAVDAEGNLTALAASAFLDQDNRQISLIAAGIVGSVDSRVSALESQNAYLSEQLAILRNLMEPLKPLVASAIKERVIVRPPIHTATPSTDELAEVGQSTVQSTTPSPNGVKKGYKKKGYRK